MTKSQHAVAPISIVIPAYNEEHRLPPFLRSVDTYIKSRPNDIGEIIVVDDGSTDATVQRARQFMHMPHFRLIKLRQNRGKGAAVHAGVVKARCDYIVFMDADGATSIDQLPKMIDALKEADIAVGNRWMKGSQTKRHSILRQVSGYVYRLYMGLFGLGKIDTMCGFKGYKTSVARDLFSSLLEYRWLFDTEIAYKAGIKGYTVKNFPITWVSKDGSKIDTKTLFVSALRIFPLIIRIRNKNSVA